MRLCKHGNHFTFINSSSYNKITLTLCFRARVSFLAAVAGVTHWYTEEVLYIIRAPRKMPWTVPVSNKFLSRKFREITEITNLIKPLMILDESKTVKDLNGGLLRSFKSQKAKKVVTLNLANR